MDDPKNTDINSIEKTKKAVKKTTRKASARKTTARKTTARKATARKTTTRKTTARKATARKAAPRKTAQTGPLPARENVAAPAATSVAAPTPSAAVTPAPARAPFGLSAADRRRIIAETAYFKAMRRGFGRGQSERDWFEAQAEVDARLRRMRNRS